MILRRFDGSDIKCDALSSHSSSSSVVADSDECSLEGDDDSLSRRSGVSSSFSSSTSVCVDVSVL